MDSIIEPWLVLFTCAALAVSLKAWSAGTGIRANGVDTDCTLKTGMAALVALIDI